MSLRRKLAYVLPLMLISLSACAVVLGIEDRELVATTQLSCESYCTAAMTHCTGEFSLYASVDSCMATCAQLALGSLDDKDVDTVGCRLRNAELAAKTGEKSEYCVNAGPGGNAVCGSDCEAYCKVMKGICPAFITTDMECMTECATVPDEGDYNILVPSENSIECRLYHLSAATIDTTHCEHAAGISRCVTQSDAGSGDGG